MFSKLKRLFTRPKPNIPGTPPGPKIRTGDEVPKGTFKDREKTIELIGRSCPKCGADWRFTAPNVRYINDRFGESLLVACWQCKYRTTRIVKEPECKSTPKN
jgi:hypothetical protein